MKLNIEKKFKQFRETLINEIYDALMEIGGTLDMSNITVSLKFDNLDNFSDVQEEFHSVEALSLCADKKVKGKVILTTVDCTEEDPETVETELDTLSADEIYNVMQKAELLMSRFTD